MPIIAALEARSRPSKRHKIAPANSSIGGVDSDLSRRFSGRSFYAAGAAVSANQALVFLHRVQRPGSRAERTSEEFPLRNFSDRAARQSKTRRRRLQVAGTSVREVTAAYRAIAQRSVPRCEEIRWS